MRLVPGTHNGRLTTNSSSRSLHSSGLCGHLHSHAHIHKKTHNFKNNKNESLKIGIIEQISHGARLTPKICTHRTKYSSLPHHQSWLIPTWPMRTQELCLILRRLCDALCRQGNNLQASLRLCIFSRQDDQSIPSRYLGSGSHATFTKACSALESSISTGILFSQHSPSPVHF